MRLITWNIAHRSSKTASQAGWIAAQRPDLVALQEVTPAIAASMSQKLKAVGLPHAGYSVERPSLPQNRNYGVLSASRDPLDAVDSLRGLPWREKALSAVVASPFGPINLTATYIPPGSSNGWTKIETIEAVVKHVLSLAGDQMNLLCGDFNAPQIEQTDGTIVTWAQRLTSEGEIRDKKTFRGGVGSRWDRAERSLFADLADAGLTDLFRSVHGFQAEAYSWVLAPKGRELRWRFDYVFANVHCRSNQL